MLSQHSAADHLAGDEAPSVSEVLPCYN
jgi:hypothetical protein